MAIREPSLGSGVDPFRSGGWKCAFFEASDPSVSEQRLLIPSLQSLASLLWGYLPCWPCLNGPTVRPYAPIQSPMFPRRKPDIKQLTSMAGRSTNGQLNRRNRSSIPPRNQEQAALPALPEVGL